MRVRMTMDLNMVDPDSPLTPSASGGEILGAGPEDETDRPPKPLPVNEPTSTE